MEKFIPKQTNRHQVHKQQLTAKNVIKGIGLIQQTVEPNKQSIIISMKQITANKRIKELFIRGE